MNTYKIRDVRFWFDRETRVWWAARYDAVGNQIGDAVHAATRDGIRREIDECLSPPSPFWRQWHLGFTMPENRSFRPKKQA